MSFLRNAFYGGDPPGAIACDRWREGELVDAVNKSKLRLPLPTYRGQGFKDGGIDIRAFKTELLEGRVSRPAISRNEGGVCRGPHCNGPGRK